MTEQDAKLWQSPAGERAIAFLWPNGGPEWVVVGNRYRLVSPYRFSCGEFLRHIYITEDRCWEYLDDKDYFVAACILDRMGIDVLREKHGCGIESPSTNADPWLCCGPIAGREGKWVLGSGVTLTACILAACERLEKEKEK